MRRICKILVGAVITLFIFLILLRSMEYLTANKESMNKYQPFLEEQENFDVLFFGSSHVIDGIFPMELWNDYGIVSYNFGGYGSRVATSYWVLMNALQYTAPELVVIDCHLIEGLDKIPQKPEQLHLSFDWMPFCKMKQEAVRDLTEEERQLEFLWNFSIYHERWKDLGQEDFERKITKEKGAASKVAVASVEPADEIDRNRATKRNTVNIKYLRKIIEECQKRDIDVLITYIPFPADVEAQKGVNRIYQIAEEYGVNYINFLRMPEIVDYDVDFYDKSHLNVSGARKITDYLGQYITEEYGIEDRRGSAEFAGWLEDYEEYTDYKTDVLRQQTNLLNYFICLQDKNFDYSMYLKTDSGLLEEEKVIPVLKNAGIGADMLKHDGDIVISVDHSQEQADVKEVEKKDIFDINGMKIPLEDFDGKIVVFNRATNDMVEIISFRGLEIFR